MAIVHVHIERTGGVSLQNLYEKKYPGPEMLWFSVRDGLFAPFNIKTANYTKDWQLKMYAHAAHHWPRIRHFMVWVRTVQRKRQSVDSEDLSKKAQVVIGHFSASQLIPYLPPGHNSYRTIVREPLARMWSHYNYWIVHNGDVGHRVVPTFNKNMSFEEFAFLPEMKNYQTQAVGNDLTIYECIGVTERLNDFALQTELINKQNEVPWVNHFTGGVPVFNESFVEAFKQAHAEDYRLYQHALELSGI